MSQKLDATKAAIACCDEALTIYPNHVKALYKRSLLYLKCGDPDAALADMSKAHESEPMNDAVVRQLAVIRARIAEYKAKEKARYSGFFDKL
jgi:tetratricopeptide (TPR) repeat protein